MPRTRIYVFAFALLVSALVSIGLAFASTLLRDDQLQSARLYVIKNIIAVSGFSKEALEKLTQKDANTTIKIFHDQFESKFINKANEEVSPEWLKTELKKLGYATEELEAMEAFELINIFNSKLALLANATNKKVEEYDPQLKLLFLYKPKDKVISYIIPIEGYGLWDMIYGYVALKPDLNTIQDIRFHKHQETPGLGGECSEPWFTNMFKGKKILNSTGDFVSVAIVKGKANDLYTSPDLNHYVDGISGGTITSRGITKFLREDLSSYNVYFKTIRK